MPEHCPLTVSMVTEGRSKVMRTMRTVLVPSDRPATTTITNYDHKHVTELKHAYVASQRWIAHSESTSTKGAHANGEHSFLLTVNSRAVQAIQDRPYETHSTSRGLPVTDVHLPPPNTTQQAGTYFTKTYLSISPSSCSRTPTRKQDACARLG